MRRIRLAGILGALLLCATISCDEDATDPGNGNGNGGGGSKVVTIEIVEAFPNLTFERPVDIQGAGDGSNRLFVVEQEGRIRVFDNVDSVSTMKTFLDITDRVERVGNEEGLLSLAFDPDYPTRPYYYVYYTHEATRRSRLARFEVDPIDRDTTLSGSQQIFLMADQAFRNHNGGQIAFGPNDGYLYLGLGDNGNSNDRHSNPALKPPQGHGQDRSTIHGNILRLDVTNHPYTIPPDNPFVGVAGVLEEIWAYGFRNPWRMSFDPVTGWLWAGDVGQNAWEEIDIVEKGQNYGWRIMEGNSCCVACEPNNQPCDPGGLTPPIWQYPNVGSAVTGGYVYRGSAIPELYGKYIYADYPSGEMWMLGYDGINPPVNEELADMPFAISSFGVDDAGELYFCELDQTGGSTKIYTFRRVETPAP